MKVRELIDELSTLDPDAVVGVRLVHHDEEWSQNVQSVESVGFGSQSDIRIIADCGAIPCAVPWASLEIGMSNRKKSAK